jgi:sec-independent protein translocase protein TatB
MSFLGVGAGEALLIFIITLLLVGPHRFPEVMRQAGRWYRIGRGFTTEVMRDVRAAVDEIQEEVESETKDLNSVRDLADMRRELEEDFAQAKREADDLGSDLDSTARETSESLEDPEAQSGASSPASGRSRNSRLLRHTRANQSDAAAAASDDSPPGTTAEAPETGAEPVPSAEEPPAELETEAPALSRAETPPPDEPAPAPKPAEEEADPLAALEARRAAARETNGTDGDGAGGR